MAREIIRRGSRRNFAGIVFTVALHGGVLLAVARAHNKPEPPLIMPHDFVRAELVKLGKPRDPFWLPRITQPPRPTAPPDQLKLSEDPNAKAAPKEAPRPEDPKISKELKNALERAKKLEALAADDDDEGSLTGSKLGTSNHAAGRSVPGAGRRPAAGELQLSGRPHARSDSGPARDHLSHRARRNDRRRQAAPSRPTNSFVDDACVDAAKLTGKVPPPPPEQCMV